MSYLYNQVKNAIGGTNVSKNASKLTDWSPNNIRAVCIMRNFLLVAYYTRQPKLVDLDENQVGLDLMNPNRVGSLNNLLGNRQLSCMEELYVDSVFQAYPGVMDLPRYVDSLISSSSRLRYYAYVDGLDPNMAASFYNKAHIDGALDCTLALNVGGFKYIDTENENWYTKFNLRPQYYSMDEPGKPLATIFNKCKKLKSEQAKALYDQKVFNEKYRSWPEKIYLDYQQYRYLAILGNFLSKVQELEPNAREIPNIKEKYHRVCKFTQVPGLTLETLKEVVGGAKGQLGTAVTAMVKRYKTLNILKDGDYSDAAYAKQFSSVGGEGFLGILTKLDKLALELLGGTTGPNGATSKTPMMRMMKFRAEGKLDPGFKLAVGSRVGKASREGFDLDPLDETIAYVNFIMGFCGWNLASYQSYVRGSSDEN